MSSIRLLKTFVAAARGGSFAAAADRMALTQPAVGQQMKLLEAEMRRPLFDKTGRTMSLTAAGSLLLPKAEALLAQYEAIRREVVDQEEIAGTVRIGSLITAMGLLSTTLAILKAAHPRLVVELRVREQPQLVNDVVSGVLDAAVLVEHQWPQAPGLRWTRCYEERLVVIASTKVQASAGDLQLLFRTQPFLRFDRQTQTGARIDRVLNKMQLRPTELLELNSLLAIVELVRKNVGFALIPLIKSFDWENDSSIQVLELPDQPIARRIGILEQGQRAHIVLAIKEEMLGQLSRPQSPAPPARVNVPKGHRT